MPRTLIIIFLMLAALCPPAWTKPKVVMFVVGSTTLEDFTSDDLPNFRKLISEGSIGLMNSRTAGTPNGEPSSTGFEAACLTIGSGTRASGGWAVSSAYNSDEKVTWQTASEVWSARTLSSKPKANVVQPFIVRISQDNSEAKYSIAAGALGKSMHDAGMKTAVVGSSDTPDELHREAAAIAMDSMGLVDYGFVIGSRLCKRNMQAPYGIASDPQAYRQVLDAVWKADFIVVDPGDTLRAGMYAEYCTTEQADRLKKWSMIQADRMLGDLISRLDLRKDLLVVLSPNAPRSAVKTGESLTPLVMWGPDWQRGLLSSASTRWDGITTNLDIAPTILSFLDVTAPGSMVGRAAYHVPTTTTVQRIRNLSSALASRSRMQPLSRWICTFQIVIILAATTAALLLRRRGRIIQSLVLLPAAVTLASLLSPLFSPAELWTGAICISVLTVCLTAAALLLLKDPAKALAVLCLSLFTVLIIDVAVGGTFLRESVLSYSASEGARYYGLGNEFMGALIGSTLVGLGLMLNLWNINEHRRQFILIVCLGLVTITIAAPFLGANTGGAMSIVPAVLVALMLRRGRTIRTAHVVMILAAIAVAVGLLVIIDSMRGSGQSHIGRFGSAVASGGLQQLYLVFARKITMNLMLLESSVWSRLMLAAGAATLVLWMYPHKAAGKVLRRSTELYAGITAALVGTAAAFTFNDSGVVAAGICLTYPWAAVALAFLQNEEPAIKKECG